MSYGLQIICLLVSRAGSERLNTASHGRRDWIALKAALFTIFTQCLVEQIKKRRREVPEDLLKQYVQYVYNVCTSFMILQVKKHEHMNFEQGNNLD